MTDLKETEAIVVCKVTALCKRFHSIERQDALQEAWLIASQSVETYDASKGAWSTWLWNQLNGRLLNWAKHEIKNSLTHQHLATELPEHGVDTGIEWDPVALLPSREPRPDRVADWNFRLEQISEDARTIVDIVLEGPAKFFSISKADGEILPPLKVRGELKRYLRTQGWSWSRLWSAFEEVRGIIAA